MAQAYRSQGYRPNGPGKIICPHCHRTISSNAMARASHNAKHARDDERKRLEAEATKGENR